MKERRGSGGVIWGALVVMGQRGVQAGDPGEAAFLSNLVEDKIGAGVSYVEFMCDIHRVIQNKLASSR